MKSETEMGNPIPELKELNSLLSPNTSTPEPTPWLQKAVNFHVSY
jgi:hypothetical protein